jgi:hypothetical protein
MTFLLILAVGFLALSVLMSVSDISTCETDLAA